MVVHPFFLYKYKPLPQRLLNEQDYKQLDYVLEILEDHKLYIPLRDELNDPMESSAVYVSLGIPGYGWAKECGMLHPTLKDTLDSFRILSLTDSPFITPMWANYANNSHGVCIMFQTYSVLSDVQPVVYTSHPFSVSEMNFPVGRRNFFHDAVRDSLLFKEKSWSYEEEWRLIAPSTQKYLDVSDNVIRGVILGSCISDEISEKLIKVCNKEKISCYRAFTLPGIGKIEIYPAEIKIDDLFYKTKSERCALWGPDRCSPFLER